MARLIPYLKFNDSKCKEAMEFYKICFGGGELFIQTIGESPMVNEVPEENRDRVMHASFKKGDIEFFASDMMQDKAITGDNVTITISCDNEEEINSYFSALSQDGEVFMPLEKQFWGGIYGVIIDKYGVEWALNYQFEQVM